MEPQPHQWKSFKSSKYVISVSADCLAALFFICIINLQTNQKASGSGFLLSWHWLQSFFLVPKSVYLLLANIAGTERKKNKYMEVLSLSLFKLGRPSLVCDL